MGEKGGALYGILIGSEKISLVQWSSYQSEIDCYQDPVDN
jgi:hypothetical protein